MNTVVNIGKGGGGKTSTAVNLAVVARQQGLKVGLIDADPQRSLSHWRAARGAADIPLRACTTEQELRGAVELARRSSFDWLFIDMPPAHAAYTLTAIGLADFTLVTMRPMLFDLAVTRKWVALLRSAARPFAVAINAAPPRRQGEDAPMVRDARQALVSIAAPLWVGQITNRLAIGYSAVGGRGVAESEPESLATAEYVALWRALDRGITEATRRIKHDPSAHAA